MEGTSSVVGVGRRGVGGDDGAHVVPPGVREKKRASEFGDKDLSEVRLYLPNG
jgi:hypothetical protein